MSAETAALIERLWQAENLDREAAYVSRLLRPQEVEALDSVISKVKARALARRVIDTGEPQHQEAAILEDDYTIDGVLKLLVLAAYHSDTLLVLPAELRHEQVVEWSKRTGFPVEIVKEAAGIGPHGLMPMLNAA